MMLPSFYFNEVALAEEREEYFIKDIKVLYSLFDRIEHESCIDFEDFKGKFF